MSDFLFEMVTELMCLMPSLPYDVIMHFNWSQLKKWHSTAVKNYNTMNGVQ